MRERPILFSGPMVKAILDGRKSQTRRVVKPQPAMGMDGFIGIAHNVHGSVWRSGLPTVDLCPYGVPGDRLWVRETCYPYEQKIYTHERTVIEQKCVYKADGGTLLNGAKWKPSIFMPRWASRITLEITGVRVERLQDISEADAKAEGVTPWEFNPEQPLTSGERAGDSPYRGGFAYLWDCINEERATWKSNPWVWVVEFRRAA